MEILFYSWINLGTWLKYYAILLAAKRIYVLCICVRGINGIRRQLNTEN